MSVRRSWVVLAPVAVILSVAIPAASSAQGGVCSPSTPQYCPPPKVKTGPAKHVTSTSATLTGTVNPNGSATTCFFEYGRTKAYGSPTPVQNEGSGGSTKQVTATITGLTPKTTYHYQLVCNNLGGRAVGGDRHFRTHAKAPKPRKPKKVQTRQAKHRKSKSAMLNGVFIPGSSATTCFFEYGRTKSYGSTTRAQHFGAGTKSRHISAKVTGLAPGTVYHDQLVCRDKAGQAKGGDKHFATRNQIRFRGSRTLLVSRHGSLTVRLHCNGNRQCVGTLSLTGKGGKQLAQPVGYKVTSHSTAQVKMTLTAGALNQIRHSHHLRGRLRARDLDGSSATRRVRLRTRQGTHVKHGPLSTG